MAAISQPPVKLLSTVPTALDIHMKDCADAVKDLGANLYA